MSDAKPSPPSGWVLYDGDCSFCTEIVERWKPTLSRRGFDFAKLQDNWVRENLGLPPGEVPDEMKVLAADGRVRGGADAVLFLAAQIWWAKPAAWIARIPGIFHLVDRRYRQIAATRRCRIGAPDPDEAFRQEMMRTSAVSASLGALAALGLAIYSTMKGQFSTVLFFLSLAPLLLVPLGLRAWVLHGAVPRRDVIFRWAVILQPFAAGAALASMLYGKGPYAASLAAAWLGATAVLAAYGCLRLLRGPIRGFADLAFVGASLLLSVGAMWLLFARLGVNPFRIEEPIATLTAVHFHYTAFAVPTILGLFALSPASQKMRGLLRACLWGVFAGIALIAAGFMSTAFVSLLGALLLCASLAPLGAWQGFGTSVFPGWRGTALRLGGLCLLAGMALALPYGLSGFLGKSWIAIDQMALFHGALNGIGFSLLGLLAWQWPDSETTR